MKHIKKAQDRATDSKAYLYTVGFFMVLGEILKTTLVNAIHHVTELLIVISIILMICSAEMFDNGALPWTATMLFMVILAILICALLKIKILEVKKK